jgi:hypothetical protein
MHPAARLQTANRHGKQRFIICGGHDDYREWWEIEHRRPIGKAGRDADSHSCPRGDPNLHVIARQRSERRKRSACMLSRISHCGHAGERPHALMAIAVVRKTLLSRVPQRPAFTPGRTSPRSWLEGVLSSAHKRLLQHSLN